MLDPKYQMSIDLNVLNHLGLKLYSNVPAVLSEVVANSWDADAEKVDIEIKSDQITITDDGHGMTEADINEKYLTVGYEKRKREAKQTHRYKRPVMGRKGIGKLSLFSIADIVEVQTVKNGKKSGFVMSAQKIEAEISKQNGSTYYPDPLSDDKITLDEDGTRIVLTELKKRVSQAPNALRKRLARRFSIKRSHCWGKLANLPWKKKIDSNFIDTAYWHLRALTIRILYPPLIRCLPKISKILPKFSQIWIKLKPHSTIKLFKNG